jgi:hypothetical protein
MRYLYYDLGEQEQECGVVARLHGSSANVILVDSLNFDRYRLGRPFLYEGGFFTRTPARLQIPWTGHWYLIIDCGGYTHRVGIEKIDVLTPQSSPTTTEPETPVVGATA